MRQKRRGDKGSGVCSAKLYKSASNLTFVRRQIDNGVSEKDAKSSLCTVLNHSVGRCQRLKGWRTGRFIGAGIDGAAFYNCSNKSGKCGVVKTIIDVDGKESRSNYRREYSVHERAAKHPKLKAFVPALYGTCSTPISAKLLPPGVRGPVYMHGIFMEAVKPKIRRVTLDDIYNALHAMRDAGFVHGDLHYGNVASRNSREQFILMDFGRSGFVKGKERDFKDMCHTLDFLFAIQLFEKMRGIPVYLTLEGHVQEYERRGFRFMLPKGENTLPRSNREYSTLIRRAVDQYAKGMGFRFHGFGVSK